MIGAFARIGTIAAAAIGCIALFGEVSGGMPSVPKAIGGTLAVFSSSVSSDDPFDRWIEQMREKHRDFVATEECRKELADLQAFWTDQGIAGAKVDLPSACIRKS